VARLSREWQLRIASIPLGSAGTPVTAAPFWMPTPPEGALDPRVVESVLCYRAGLRACFLGLPGGADPSASFLEHLRDRDVRPASRYLADGPRADDRLCLRITSVRPARGGTTEVRGVVLEPGMLASPEAWLVERRDGRWSVRDDLTPTFS
jgi:hypothetical protein